jgi:hypothetical protein
MRHLASLLGMLVAFQGLAGEEPRPAHDHVVVHFKVIELQLDGKEKVLAEPVFRTNLKKPISFNSGQEVPVKTSLGSGIATIDYVPVGARMELIFERIEGDGVWGNLVAESIHVVDDKDGLFTTHTSQYRKRGKFVAGKAIRTAPVKLYSDERDERRVQFEFRVELASSAELTRRPGNNPASAEESR